MAHVGVIGAGIAGLTAAHHLQQHSPHTVSVLEATSHVGGVIRSERTEGYLIEHGPNSLRASSEALGQTIMDLGLMDSVVKANSEAATRYVVRDGVPVALPLSVSDFVTTPLFSARAKWRLLREPFVSRSASDEEESVASFVRRRLGPEILDYAVAPFVGGVFAGRPDALSVQHAFERLSELETDHGSLLWGGLRSALQGDSERPPGPSGLFSFQNGLQTLPAALHEALGEQVYLDAPVSGLTPKDEQWIVQHDGNGAATQFDGVICTAPLHRVSDLMVETSVDCTPLYDVAYPPLQVVALGYKREAIAHPLDGFGLLVPPVEDTFDILGTIFSSTLFPNRAPEGHVLLTTFVGGARAPDQARTSEKAIRHIVERDLDRLLGVQAPPTFARHIHWPHAIPQYALGYGAVKDTLSALESAHPGLVFAGNYRQGVSVGDAMDSGLDAARRLASTLSP